jgi:hypothetical protein
MKTKLYLMLILMAIMLMLIPTGNAMADVGPKPTMDFTFTQEFSGDQVSIISGTLLECEQSDCSDAEPLPQLGPQNFSCQGLSCHALAYGFSTYHRLEIQFSDGKTRLSNVFKTGGFNGDYAVTIRQDDLLVKAEFSLSINPYSPTNFIVLGACCLLTLIIAVVVIILIIRKVSRRKSV